MTGHRAAFVVIVCAWLLAPLSSAYACSLDGIASIAVNGATAGLTGGSATAGNAAHWAPFTLIAVAPGHTLHLNEDIGKLRRSIPASLLSRPFRWSFGDGASQIATSAVHRYLHPGWRRITVSYYWPVAHRWVEFDSAQLQIVPSGDLWRANLGYNIGRIFMVLVRVTVWGVAAVLVVVALWRWLAPGWWRSRARSSVSRHTTL